MIEKEVIENLTKEELIFLLDSQSMSFADSIRKGESIKLEVKHKGDLHLMGAWTYDDEHFISIMVLISVHGEPKWTWANSISEGDKFHERYLTLIREKSIDSLIKN